MTNAEVMALAGLALNNADPVAEIRRMAYLNSAIQTACRLRPDLMMGRSAAYPQPNLTETDEFPIDPLYAQALADYVTARSSLVDVKPVDMAVAVSNIDKALRIALGVG